MAGQLIARKALFTGKRETFQVMEGTSVLKALQLAGWEEELYPYTIVSIGGEPVPQEYWARVKPINGTDIYVGIAPKGGEGRGKQILAMVAILAIAVVAWYVAAPLAAGALGFAAGTTGFTIATGVIASGLTMMGAMGVNALIVPPVPKPPKTPDITPGQRYSLSGASNTMAPYQPCLKVFGRVRVTPPFIAEPVIIYNGPNQILIGLLDFGIGTVTVEDIRIGTTPIGNFGNRIKYKIHQNFTDPGLLTIYSGDNAVLTINGGLSFETQQIRQIPESASYFVFDLVLPGGLFKVDKSGDRKERIEQIKIEARQSPAHPWRPINDVGFASNLYYTGGAQPPIKHLPDNKQGASVPKYLSVIHKPGGIIEFAGATPDPTVMMIDCQTSIVADWEVRVTRLTKSSTDPGFQKGSNQVISNALTWQSLRSISPKATVSLRVPHTIMEIMVIASEELTGQIEHINALCTAHYRHYLGGDISNPASFGYDPSRNPAWAYAELLHGTANRSPVTNIDWVKIRQWAIWCGEASAQGDPRCTFDMVVDDYQTIGELATLICSVGRATPTIKDGLYSVFMEAEERLPVQIFTPQNARGFTSRRLWGDVPKALKVNILSEDTWQQEEVIVYNDNYDVYNAHDFETVDFAGIVRRSQAWRAGRYYLAVGMLRREVMEFSTDIENLVCTRGDLILIQHDQLLGGNAARVTEVLSPTQIRIDYAVEAFSDKNGIIIRRQDGSQYGPTTCVFNSTLQILILAVPDVGISPGDLIIIGTVGQETTRWIIDKITPGPDITAVITCQEERREILYADQHAIPIYIPPMIGTGIVEQIAPPRWVNIIVSPFFNGPIPMARIQLYWDKPIGYAVQFYALYRRDAGWWRRIHQTNTSEGQLSFFVDVNLHDVGTYGIVESFGIQAISPRGNVSEIVPYDVWVGPDTTAPPSTILSTNVTSEEVMLMWDGIRGVPDLAGYEIRWTAEREAGAVFWERMTVVMTVAANVTRVTAHARNGTYAVAAYDNSGNYGPATYSSILIEELPNIDYVSQVDALPNWVGEFVDTELVDPIMDISVPVQNWTAEQRTPTDFSRITIRMSVEAAFTDGQKHWVKITPQPGSMWQVGASHRFIVGGVERFSVDKRTNINNTTQIPPNDMRNAVLNGQYLEVQWTNNYVWVHKIQNELPTMPYVPSGVWELRLKKQPDGTYPDEGWWFASSKYQFPSPWRMRIRSEIDIYPFNALSKIENWTPIIVASPLDDTRVGRDYNASVYFVKRENAPVLGNEWFSPLGNANPFIGPSIKTYPWQELHVTDLDATEVGWAIRLVSSNPAVTPSVQSASVIFDHLERREFDYDVTVPAGGVRIEFSHQFWNIPAVAITMENMQPGDRFVRSNIDEFGFDVECFNASNVSVTRQCDWQALGFGKGTI